MRLAQVAFDLDRLERATAVLDQVGVLARVFEAQLLVARRGENMGLLSDPAHLLVEACGPSNVDTVLVDGRILKRDGKLTHIDVENLTAKTSSEFNSLRQRANWRV